jgi:fumarylacetoacetate (FAA) hydrolase family protein
LSPLLLPHQAHSPLEVGLGRDAEVFTKGQAMSSIGFGAKIGVHPKSG